MQSRPVSVEVVDGRIVAIGDAAARIEVESVQDHWRIATEWWRDPIRRRYYQVRTIGGVLRTIYQDVIHDRWFEQRY